MNLTVELPRYLVVYDYDCGNGVVKQGVALGFDTLLEAKGSADKGNRLSMHAHYVIDQGRARVYCVDVIGIDDGLLLQSRINKV